MAIFLNNSKKGVQSQMALEKKRMSNIILTNTAWSLV
jgi:hypothetical protein